MNRPTETIRYALVNLHSGALVRALDDQEGCARLTLCAERARDLLASGDDVDWASLFGRLGEKLAQQEFQELVLVSAGRVYVLERLSRRPGLALAAVAVAGEGLGLVLAGVHGKRVELDVE